MKYFPTTQNVINENYPYGFRERTTRTCSLEFNPKKGFRFVTQTINPKNNRPNKPKASTYATWMLIKEENGQTSYTGGDFNGVDSINRSLNILKDNFDLFTPEQIKYLYKELAGYLFLTSRSVIAYCGADKTKAIEFFKPLLTKASKAEATENIFADLLIDVEAYKALKDPNFDPFKPKVVPTIRETHEV